MATVDIRVLGPVEMWVNSEKIPLGTPKQRCLLAALVMNPGRPVSLETLAERLWGDEAPGGVNNNISTYVARLRQLLRHESSGEVELRRHADSYTLEIASQQVDLWLARALADQAATAVSGGRDEHAVRSYRCARGLWRGDPLCGLRGAWAERTRTSLRRERVAAVTQLFAAELRLGRHEQVIGELSLEAADAPLDEALAGQLMLSLYRSHRHAEALAVFHRIKADLADRIGVDPDRGLRRLYGEILRNDARLELPAVR